MTLSAKNIFAEKDPGRSQNLGLLKKLAPFVMPYRLLMAFSLVLIILLTGLELAIPYVTKIAIDRYIVPETGVSQNSTPDSTPDKSTAADSAKTRFLACRLSDPEIAAIVSRRPDLFKINGNTALITYENLSRLPRQTAAQLRKDDLTGVSRAAAGLLVLVLAAFCLNFINVFIMEYAGQQIMHDIRLRLFSHIQRLSVQFFTRNPVGRLVTRVTNDTQNMHEMFTSVLIFVVKDIFMLMGITIILFSIDWQLSFVVYTIFPLVFLAAYRFSRSARQAFRTLRVKVAEINSRFSETIGGMQVIQLFRQEKTNYRRFRQTNQEHFDAGMQQITVFALFMPLIEMLSSVALAIVIFYGGKSIIAGRISLGTLVVFISYIRMFFRPIRDIAEKYNITLNALSSAERMLLLLEDTDMLPEPDDGRRARMPEKLTSIAFDHVSLSYVDGETVIDDISFSITSGETIAIVGPTGAGKTSLVNLMVRFYDPDNGIITFNGINIQNLAAADLRSKIAIVTQDPYIFSGTIRCNVFPDTTEFAESTIVQILKTACCDTFIDKLPNGLDTEMTESGASLSSGERQLLSIARALAHDPEVIIFDEATSYVDSETENSIQKALTNLMKNRTSLVIAHRLSTARGADRIMVLRGGKIIETGTHEQLLRQNGFYFRLNALQG